MTSCSGEADDDANTAFNLEAITVQVRNTWLTTSGDGAVTVGHSPCGGLACLMVPFSKTGSGGLTPLKSVLHT